jgi:acyl-CoA oxidase
MLQFERDPIMKTIDSHEFSLEQHRMRSMQKIRRMASYLTTESVNDFKIRMQILTLLDPGSWTRIGVHYGLFFGALQGQATPEQFSYWAAKGAVTLNGLVGCVILFFHTQVCHDRVGSWIECGWHRNDCHV